MEGILRINDIEIYEIFKVIMSFDDPKPRNIEKNIKIYRWDSLEASLSKILPKYCINFSDYDFNSEFT
ncbi:uncharacterized protein ASCRUDRAFT_30998 [Ascoidea rubescens DSM 1968]|uniref:DUF7082 domain-containing protein n=1 Tax=Ascoidea rubescens DSM 1968 TaxID=1344418 RepID=A0A1D2VRQ1_9ASCO|nr:hypothetical protein ASCRUDRAFT_30998 [Ascoidea rubescens DSM 1968]ODV64247.1 hypothetical protein ASCRUDRAFT_30998 [Ascoidea rubescens DSM 1968]